MQARTYLTAYGKFAQVDPAYDQTKDDPETWDLYNYVTNNPVTHTDPDGRADTGPTFIMVNGEVRVTIRVTGKGSQWDNWAGWNVPGYAAARARSAQITKPSDGKESFKNGSSQSISSSSASISLPSSVPPLPSFPNGGGSISAATLHAYAQEASGVSQDFGKLYSFWLKTAPRPSYATYGTRSGPEGGSMDPTTGAMHVNAAKVTSYSATLMKRASVGTIAHEIRHWFQVYMANMFGSVSLGIARDSVTGEVTWKTFTNAEIQNCNRQAAEAAERGDLRTYAMTPTEVDARIFLPNT